MTRLNFNVNAVGRNLHVGQILVNYILSNSVRSKLVILTHGYTEGASSAFISYLSDRLREMNVSVVSFDFSYLKKKKEPSSDFIEELDELEAVINYCKKVLKYKKIFIVGKSMGGIIALMLGNRISNSVYGMAFLGLPIRLGYPLKLSILKNGKLVKRGFIKPYAEMISRLPLKILIIVGENDCLGSPDDIIRLIKKSTNPLIEYQTIIGVSHSFRSSDKPLGSDISNYRKVLERLSEWVASTS